MRKIAIMLMAFVIAVAMVLPAVAGDQHAEQTPGIPAQGPTEMTTQTIITTGGGESPIIKAKWESTDMNGWTEDDLIAPGTQVNPELLGDKYVYYWVVVTDSPLSDIDTVYADVWHPDGTFKYQVLLPYYYENNDAELFWEDVYTNNPSIIYFNTDYTYEEIAYELSQQTARIYYGQAKLSYCQPAGEYHVEAVVYDGHANTDLLDNYFWYVPIVGVDYDFDVVDYDSVHGVYLDAWNQLDGDRDMGTPLKPTVRTTGNVPVFFAVYQDDMGFGKTGGTDWNVKYKARLGDDPVMWTPEYFPEVNQTLPGYLPLCTEEKLDFQINPDKLSGPGIFDYSGTITFWATQYGTPPYDDNYYEPEGWTV
jgi:hypothetical protein